MRLNQPKRVTFWISLAAFVVGAVLAFGVLPFIPAFVGVIVAILAYALLALGLLVKGL